MAARSKDLVRPGAHAFVHGPDPLRFYAQNQHVLERVLAVQLVGRLPAGEVSSELALRRMRDALREERWADALIDWMKETERVVDVFDSAPDLYESSARVWTDDDLDELRRSLEETPLFDDAD